MGVSRVLCGPHVVNIDQRCECNKDIAPARSKMKVLKKIKKRIGLSPRSCSGIVSHLPPILFHHVHGDNVRIFQDGLVAKRVESFCRGITFSNRPIKVQERVYVKFDEVSNNWSGVIRFGFTSTDPRTLRCSLPKYACPDLTDKPGYWAKALAERFAERDTVLFYYVTPSGDVHFGINDEDKGIFFSGVDTRGPLWALFDIYGNSTAIELIPQRSQLNNCRTSQDADTVLPALQALSLSPRTEENPIETRFYPSGLLTHLPFHKTRGHNIRLSNDGCVATRCETEFCHGYVFTARPIRLEEKIIIQVLATETMYVGALSFGLTSCDPSQLTANELPEDADALLDRREYWVVSKDVASIPHRGDELAFCVSSLGEVTISKNGGNPVVFMHIDHTLQLWAFFDVYGSTQRIKIAGALQGPTRQEVTRARHSIATPSPERSGVISHRHCCLPPSAAPATASVPAPTAELLQLQPTLGGGTVLVVNLPPAQSNYVNQQNTRMSPSTHMVNQPPPPIVSHHSAHSVSHSPHPLHSSHLPHPADRSSSLLSNYSNTYIEPVSGSSYSTSESIGQWVEMGGATGNTGAGSECSICYERAIDSVLYMCGHMCMCFECAVQQWRGKGGGHCPLCRAVIRDVIRTYKS